MNIRTVQILFVEWNDDGSGSESNSGHQMSFLLRFFFLFCMFFVQEMVDWENVFKKNTLENTW